MLFQSKYKALDNHNAMFLYCCRAAAANKPDDATVEGNTNNAFTNSAGTVRSFASIHSKFAPTNNGDTDSLDSMAMEEA